MNLSVAIIPATRDQQPVLANLLELYAHDFSEFQDLELGENGQFGYKALPLYWSEPDRFPFFVRVDGKLAGFALVKKGPEVSGDEAIWDMAEFFVVRGYRRRGIGNEMAHQLWRQLPGRWEIRVMELNRPGQQFWERAISTFTGKPASSIPVAKNGKRWRIFSFKSEP